MTVSAVFAEDYPHLALYCDLHKWPYPEVTFGKPQTKGAIASCDPYSWGVIVDKDFGQVSEKAMGHELAHLIVRIDDRGDSITHGKKFISKEMEIEKFCLMERRKAIRAKRA